MQRPSDTPSPRPVEILLVEDSPTDRLITTSALAQARLLNSVHTVGNGLDALAFLRREGSFVDAPRPDLVLLDLNMPRMDGREVLARMKADPSLRDIPVVVLTTSASPDDIAAAYAAHANSYITKPVDFQRFTAALQVLERYWFEVVALPPVLDSARRARSLDAPPVRVPATNDVVSLLLVEDSATDALLLQTALENTRLGTVEIVHVARLSQAREQLMRRRFSAVLTDLHLPDADGLTAVNQLRGNTAGAPILVLTGNTSDALGVQAMEQGADDYLSKDDLTGPTLARAIQFAIHRRDAREDRHQRERVEAVGRLAAGVAHDFNNLLTAIAGCAELALSAESKEDASRCLRDIIDTTDRGRTLTRQLLSFGRRDRFDPQRLELNAVVMSLTTLLRRLLRPIVRVEVRLTAVGTTIRADQHLVEQVLINLGMNASDAMATGGVITLSTDVQTLDAATASRLRNGLQPGRYAVIGVRDTGEGIPNSLLQHIFEPFYTTKEEGIGTGLGLASAREIVEQHGGAITVESETGRGTAFRIFLPAADSNDKPTPIAGSAVIPESAPNADGTTVTAKILLAEDDPLVRGVMERVLRRRKHEVLSADTAAGALALYREHVDTIDLVITDLLMPGVLTAYDFIELLQEERPQLPIICCSGYSQALVEQPEAFEEGRNFLSKPFRVEQLESIVDRALSESRT